MTRTEAARTPTEGAIAQPAIPRASRPQARMSAARSPMRAARAPAGRSPASWPMPISAIMNAATLIPAPSSRADRTTTGSTAPDPTALRAVGPYAESAISRRLRTVSTITSL